MAKTKKWKQKLRNDGSYLSEELSCETRYRLILCSSQSTIRSNEKLRGGMVQFNVRRSIQRRLPCIILSVFLEMINQTKCSIQSAKTRQGADCGSDHELLIAKFRLKLKKVGKTTRSFRYDLNQIPYNYTVEVRNRFEGLDWIDRVPEELWMKVHDIVQETEIKTIPKKKKCKKAKWLSGETLQIAVKRREVKNKREKEDISI